MKTAPDQRQFYNREDVMMSNDGSIHLHLPGSVQHDISDILAPKVEAVREMLSELRARLRWSQAFTATVLGVPLVTLRKWENGSRNPSGAARKLIWLLHDRLVTRTSENRTAYDMAMWGTVGSAPPKEAEDEPGVSVTPTQTVKGEEFWDEVKLKLAKMQELGAAL